MQVELLKIVNSYDRFMVLTKKRYSNWGVALKLADAAKQLESKRAFYAEKERELIMTYVMKDENGKFQFSEQGQPKFESVEKATEFNTELVSLQRTLVDVFEPVVISITDFRPDEESLTPEDIIILSDFVIFECNGQGGQA